jgi:hypothetical protein
MKNSSPMQIAGRAYDADTLDLLGVLLDETWARLSESQRNQWPRSLIADRLLTAMAAGERDPAVLRMRALDGVPPDAPLGPM